MSKDRGKSEPKKFQPSLEEFVALHKGEAVKRHTNDIFFTEEALVTPNEMFVDTRYQRDPAERTSMHKKIIAEGFNINRAEPLHIHIRKNKEIVVLDGGGRWFIMKNLLGMGHTQVKCLNHPFIKTVEDEAAVYLYLNTPHRMKVNQAQKHKARIVLNDETALEIESGAAEGGLTVLGQGKNRIPYAAAETLNHWNVLEQTGYIKNAAWPKMKIDSWLYMAIGAVLKACPTIKEKFLIETLIDNPPPVLHGKIKAVIGFGKPHARNMPPKMAELIVSIYNKKKSSNRIEPNWKRVDDLCKEKPFSDRWGWYEG